MKNKINQWQRKYNFNLNKLKITDKSKQKKTNLRFQNLISEHKPRAQMLLKNCHKENSLCSQWELKCYEILNYLTFKLLNQKEKLNSYIHGNKPKYFTAYFSIELMTKSIGSTFRQILMEPIGESYFYLSKIILS